MDPIVVEHVAKKYRIGEGQAAYGRITEVLSEAFSRRGKRERRTEDTLWALKDVSLTVKQGEIVGIIGRNGAGKTTLLKLLSRITEPTEGVIRLHGRVGSLLEVGTGFHPELTGRENIYLNGAILGMKRSEIVRRFDEIVDFAGIERFIETPVKRYSSGMYVRLAFAVAAHLEPEVLIIDEVLAVGDAAFQQKCLRKVDEISTSGRTSLIVSHNMASIRQLCTRAVLLEDGRMTREGEVEDVIGAYLSGERGDERASFTWPREAAPGNDAIKLRRLSLVGDDSAPRNEFGMHESVQVEIEYDILEPTRRFYPALSLHSADGSYILFSTESDWSGAPASKQGTLVSRCSLPSGLLNSGEYYVVTSGALHHEEEVFTNLPRLWFHVIATGEIAAKNVEPRRGLLAPVLSWTVEERQRG